MGGLIVQKYLEEHTASAAVLLASVPPAGLLRTTIRFLARYPLPTLHAVLTLSVYPLVASRQRYGKVFLSADVPEDDLRRFHSRLQDDSFRALLDMIFLDLPDPDRARRVPMLVVGGDDFLVSAAQVRATGRAFGGEAELFPGMGHAMMLDSGWLAVAEHAARWLAAKGL
jgi:alpha-beta hydrolase superfamily lysophospholipase